MLTIHVHIHEFAVIKVLLEGSTGESQDKASEKVDLKIRSISINEV